MSDSDRRDSGSTSAEWDYEGLLPGGDQPRRRRPSRGGRREAPVDTEVEASRETGALGETSNAEEVRPRDAPAAGARQSAESGAPEDEVPNGAATRERRADGRGVGEGKPAPDEPPRSEEPARPERTSPADQVSSERDGASREPGSLSGASSEGVPMTEAGDTPLPSAPGPAAPPEEAERAVAAPVTRPSPGTRGMAEPEARSTARDTQVAHIEGHDVDRIMQRISALSPEQRSAYKSSIMLSEAHYELLTDLRKEFRRRGFTGMDVTMSNVIAIGLELVRQTLDAEKNLPG